MKAALLALVRGYRFFLSPWFGNQCRFYPTCSAYALEAIERHGAARGALLSGARILRCNPWNECGIDPVPGHFAWRCLCHGARPAQEHGPGASA